MTKLTLQPICGKQVNCWTSSRRAQGSLLVIVSVPSSNIPPMKTLTKNVVSLRSYGILLSSFATRCSCYMQCLGCQSKYSNTQNLSAADVIGRTGRDTGMPRNC